ncbi:bacterio-opsin activator domain-containing protein [Natronomonas sp. CBA1123]|uniref:bacterio-opsin activator domain-containing protein n=1 Tax=Natronomonas sp. CBA1123 TaxID=2668070 RepID=UPI0012E9A23C
MTNTHTRSPRLVFVGGPEDQRSSTRAALSEVGFDVESADTAAACLDAIAEGSVDAVVTAYELPESTGVDLVQSVRERFATLPVVLSPADGSERIAGKALAEGASGYVGSDQSPAVLVSRLEACLAERDSPDEETGRYRNLIQTSPAPINIFDEDGTTLWGNDAVVELLGLSSRSELIGRSIFEFIHPEDQEIAESELAEIVTEEIATGPTYMRLVRDDGEIRHVRIATAPGRFQGERIGQAVAVDVTALRTQERRLERLNELLAEWIESETKASIAESLVGAAEAELNLPVTAVLFLDEETGELRPVSQTAGAQTHLDNAALLPKDGGLAWEVFLSGDANVVENPGDGILEGEAPVEQVYLEPLGRHGVLVVGADAGECDFVEILTENLRAMFDRIERESLLSQRETLLAEQNERLGRLERINSVVRNVAKGLVGASTRAEIETAVCRELVDTDLYTLAWVGEHEPSTGAVRPRASAGDERGYLDAVSISADDSETGQGPAGRAIRTHESQVVDDTLTDPPFEPWREAALERGYRAGISLPLVYRDSLYGILNIYSTQPEVFDDDEREVLEELSDLVAHAINAIESKRALVSDSVVELELELQWEASAYPLVEFLEAESGRTFELEATIPAEEDTYRIISTFEGVSPDAVEAFTERTRTVHSVQLLGRREDACTVECVVADDNVVFWLIDHGAVPRSLTLSHDSGRLVVELPAGADVRRFIEMLAAEFGDVELRSRRDHERSVRPRQTFLTTVENRLTDRQREILETAYFSGYFEKPRRRTGGEIAESIGISQPTFSDHLRASQRNLLELLYEDRTVE